MAKKTALVVQLYQDKPIKALPEWHEKMSLILEHFTDKKSRSSISISASKQNLESVFAKIKGDLNLKDLNVKAGTLRAFLDNNRTSLLDLTGFDPEQKPRAFKNR
jgi:hypothetical protein